MMVECLVFLVDDRIWNFSSSFIEFKFIRAKSNQTFVDCSLSASFTCGIDYNNKCDMKIISEQLVSCVIYQNCHRFATKNMLMFSFILKQLLHNAHVATKNAQGCFQRALQHPSTSQKGNSSENHRKQTPPIACLKYSHITADSASFRAPSMKPKSPSSGGPFMTTWPGRLIIIPSIKRSQKTGHFSWCPLWLRRAPLGLDPKSNEAKGCMLWSTVCNLDLHMLMCAYLFHIVVGQVDVKIFGHIWTQARAKHCAAKHAAIRKVCSLFMFAHQGSSDRKCLVKTIAKTSPSKTNNFVTLGSRRLQTCKEYCIVLPVSRCHAHPCQFFFHRHALIF